jgi:hypothetical protein
LFCPNQPAGDIASSCDYFSNPEAPSLHVVQCTRGSRNARTRAITIRCSCRISTIVLFLT